jgi:hypothetical protein
MARLPLTQATKEQKLLVNKLFGQGKTNIQIAQALGLEERQIGPIKAHFTRGTYPREKADTLEAVEALEKTTLSLERDLQRALRSNIGQLEAGLKVVDGGKEQAVPSGRIDILAEDSDGTTVVIELKVGTAERDAVGQILSYMGNISETTPDVRGIIVAMDFAPPVISAARFSGKIRLLSYTINFSFERVGV